MYINISQHIKLYHRDIEFENVEIYMNYIKAIESYFNDSDLNISYSTQ